MMQWRFFFACMTCLSLISLTTFAQQARREVKWNHPDGPKISGVEHGSFHSPSMETEVGYNVYLPEGYAGSNRKDVWHSADGVLWHEVPNTPWKARHAASVFVHDDALWVAAGNNMESDVWKPTWKKK